MIAALAALAVGGAALAQAPAQPTYPTALDRDGLSAWLREATDLPPEQVVAVSPSAATAIVERTHAPDGRMEARLRAVAITPQAAARSGVLAWEMKLEVDCQSGEVRPGATIGFATRRAGPEGVALVPADAGWRRPKPNTTLDASWRAVCDAHFQPPLTAAPTRVAEASPATPAPVAAPAVAPVVAQAETQASPAPARLTRANIPLASPPQESRTPAKPAPASAKPARPAPARTGHMSVQVVSSPVEAETRQKLAALQRKFGAALQGAETRVEPAQVNGRTVYRGIVAGFATRSEARAFCQTLKRDGRDCMAR